jgi:Zn-dependent protease with chaperone function
VTNQGPSASSAKAGEAPDRYYDGRNAVAHPVRVNVTGSKLKIVGIGAQLLAEWPLAEIETVDRRSNDGAMAFALASALRKGDGARLILADSGARNLLLTMRPELARWKRQRSHRGLKRAVVWGGIVAGLFAVFYFTFPLLAEEAARAMPRRWEMPIGQSMRHAFVSLSPTCHGEEGIAALMGLLTRLAPDEIEDPPLTLDVIDGSTVNAFALPGNHIVVFRGLIEKAGSGNEVAGVLAHELGHLDLRHPMQNAIQQVGLGAVMTMLLGGSDAGAVGQVLVGLTYTRRMEAAADARGVALLEAAGLRADGLASFFRRLSPLGVGGGLLPDWLASHPGLADRIAATDRPATGDDAFDARQWAAVRAVCASTGSGAGSVDTNTEAPADSGSGNATDGNGGGEGSGAGTVAAPDDNGIGKPVSGATRIKPTKSNP